jgi:hypothetical protein
MPLYDRPLNNGGTVHAVLEYRRDTPLTIEEFEALRVGILTKEGVKVKIHGAVRYDGGFGLVYRGGFAQKTVTSNEFPSDRQLYLTEPEVAGYQYDREDNDKKGQQAAGDS